MTYGLTSCDRIKNLTANPLKHKPGVNQVELNLFNPQPELLAVRPLIFTTQIIALNSNVPLSVDVGA